LAAALLGCPADKGGVKEMVQKIKAGRTKTRKYRNDGEPACCSLFFTAHVPSLVESFKGATSIFAKQLTGKEHGSGFLKCGHRV